MRQSWRPAMPNFGQVYVTAWQSCNGASVLQAVQPFDRTLRGWQVDPHDAAFEQAAGTSSINVGDQRVLT